MTVNTTQGTLLQREITPGGGTYATIAQITNVGGVPLKKKFIEVRTHDSVYPVVKPTVEEAVALDLELLFDPADTYHEALRTDRAAGTLRSYQIIYPDSGAYQQRFNAYVESFEYGEAPAEGKELTAKVTLKATALPTVTL